LPKIGKTRVLDTETAVLQELTRKTDLTTRDPFGPFEAVANCFLRVPIVYSISRLPYRNQGPPPPALTRADSSNMRIKA
jgi:hypothetical protein